MATKPKDIIARIKDNDIEWVDLRFTDPKGKWQHLTMCAGVIDEELASRGGECFHPDCGHSRVEGPSA